MTRYTAAVTREGDWWVAQVAPIDYATQARRLADVSRQVADLIETVTDVRPSPEDITMDVELPGDAAAAWGEAVRLRVEALERTQRSAELARQAAHELSAAGLSVRDIGTALGVSHQRAHQLVTNT